MKYLKKINENKTEFIICMIIDLNNVDYCGVFETEQDFENWILNIINKNIQKNSELKQYDSNIEGLVENNNGEPIFIDFRNAINWFQDYYNVEVYYDTTNFYKNIKAKYGVELFKNSKKYNL